jgi:hypothetical protein
VPRTRKARAVIDIYFRLGRSGDFFLLGTFDTLNCLRTIQDLRDAGCEVQTVRWPDDWEA